MHQAQWCRLNNVTQQQFLRLRRKFSKPFFSGTNSPILEKGLLYTALTRSMRLTIIVGRREFFEKAVLRLNKATEVCHGLELHP